MKATVPVGWVVPADDRDVVGGTEAHRLGLRAEGMELNLINLWPATNVVRHLTNFRQSVLGCIDA